jgi:hypothetical protein
MHRMLNLWAVPMVLMSPEGDGGGTGGTGGSTGSAGGDGDPATKVVPLDVHKRTLDEVHATKGQLKTVADQLAAVQNELNSIKTKGAESSGDFKSLYDQKSQELEQLKTTHGDFKKSVFNNERLRSLEAELKSRGLKSGNESLVDFADLEKMPNEITSRGRILVHGVKEVANELEQKYSFAFEKPKPPNVNGGGGNNGTGENTGEELTATMMVELETKDPKRYRELYPKYLEQWKQRNAK